MKEFERWGRNFKPEDTVVRVDPVEIGTARPVVIAGPCAVETKDQINKTAEKIKECGGDILRGGGVKPRTSPHSEFRGLGWRGFELLKRAGEANGLPVVAEVMTGEHIKWAKDSGIDILQIGTRNAQNFELLVMAGRTGLPILLKRGMGNNIREFLSAAEWILLEGKNPNVILCERGVKGFNEFTRNQLDIAAVQVIRHLSHLPIIVDPSHALGERLWVPRLALASLSAGAAGIMVEVHPNPEEAKIDGEQSLDFAQFEIMMKWIKDLTPVIVEINQDDKLFKK